MISPPENDIFSSAPTAVSVSRDYAITNYHVIDGCSKTVVYMNGNPIVDRVAASFVTDDLGIIKLTEPSIDQISFRDSGRVRLGEDIWVTGYPLL